MAMARSSRGMTVGPTARKNRVRENQATDARTMRSGDDLRGGVEGMDRFWRSRRTRRPD
jgi:hypothetical protein